MLEQPFWTVAGLTGRIGVSTVTLQRWKRTRRLPPWALILISILSGELAAIDAAFAGWMLRAGELISPEGWCFTPGELRATRFLHAQVSLWRQEALELRAAIAANPQYSLPLEEPRHEKPTALHPCHPLRRRA